jgi:spore coat protein U-like protein
MRTYTRVSAALAALLSLAATAARAQSANITATATVYQAMTVSGARTLDFGSVFPGVNKSIGVAAATSGQFALTGQNSANLNLTFTLPTDLTSGANNLPIGTWTGCHNTSNSTAGCTAFTPSAAATASAFSGTGSLWVWVGGTVSPAANQASGTYTGTVTLTAAYF